MLRTDRIIISLQVIFFEEYSYFIINLTLKAASKILYFIKAAQEQVEEEELGLEIKLFIKCIENYFMMGVLLVFNQVNVMFKQRKVGLLLEEEVEVKQEAYYYDFVLILMMINSIQVVVVASLEYIHLRAEHQAFSLTDLQTFDIFF